MLPDKVSRGPLAVVTPPRATEENPPPARLIHGARVVGPGDAELFFTPHFQPDSRADGSPEPGKRPRDTGELLGAFHVGRTDSALSATPGDVLASRRRVLSPSCPVKAPPRQQTFRLAAHDATRIEATGDTKSIAQIHAAFRRTTFLRGSSLRPGKLNVSLIRAGPLTGR